MYGFCRLGLRPAPSSGAACVANGLATTTSRNRRSRRDAGEHGRHPHDEVARAPAVEPDGERRVAGQDQQPEEQRALLPAPERGELVDPAERAARVVGDVGEREVVADERGGEHDGRDEGRPERGDERVPGRVREPAPAERRGVRRPRRARRGDRPSVTTSAARPSSGIYSRLGFVAVYFDGHFVTIEPGLGDERAVARARRRRRCPADREQVRDRARVEDGHGRRAVDP